MKSSIWCVQAAPCLSKTQGKRLEAKPPTLPRWFFGGRGPLGPSKIDSGPLRGFGPLGHGPFGLDEGHVMRGSSGGNRQNPAFRPLGSQFFGFVNLIRSNQTYFALCASKSSTLETSLVAVLSAGLPSVKVSRKFRRPPLDLRFGT